MGPKTDEALPRSIQLLHLDKATAPMYRRASPLGGLGPALNKGNVCILEMGDNFHYTKY